MVKIPVKTSDRHVWNLPDVLLELAHAMAHDQDIVLDFLAEGPDIAELGLLEHIDRAACMHDYDISRVCVQTANLVESHDKFRITKTFAHHLALHALGYDTNANKHTHLKHFGFFVGRNNALRVYLGSILKSRFDQKTLHINHFRSHDEFAAANIGLDSLIRDYGIADVSDQAKYLAACPLNARCITMNKDNNRNHAQQLLDNDHEHFVTLYQDFFLEVVCETYFTGNTFFPTEKIWRPMLLRTPFIVQGPRHFLANLKRWGFRTFDQWWDEGYDQDPPNWSVNEIVRVLERLSTLDCTQLYQWWQEMQPLLDHNRNLLLEICHDQKRFPF